MIVEEIFAEVHTDGSGRYLKVSVGETPFYIHEDAIPSGIAGADTLFKKLSAMPRHEILEQMLTPADMGGLQAQINPGEDLGFIIDNEGLFQSFSFDEEVSVLRLVPQTKSTPHGVVKINIYADTPDGMQERVIAIEFGIDFPLVAQFMSRAHPQPWVYEFLSELDEKTDALEITHIYRKYKRDGDRSWYIGLPVFKGGFSRPPADDFINMVVECQALPLITSGSQLLRLAHECQENRLLFSDWMDEHKDFIPAQGFEHRFAHDLGL